jgi:hypothetical protein
MYSLPFQFTAQNSENLCIHCHFKLQPRIQKIQVFAAKFVYKFRDQKFTYPLPYIFAKLDIIICYDLLLIKM